MYLSMHTHNIDKCTTYIQQHACHVQILRREWNIEGKASGCQWACWFAMRRVGLHIVVFVPSTTKNMCIACLSPSPVYGLAPKGPCTKSYN